MRKIILYAHLEKSNVRENQKVKGGSIVGTMGSTGMADGAHLHFGYIECPDNVLISANNFTSRNQKYCVDPKKFTNKYGKVSDGVITLDFGALYATTYTVHNPHPGIDYSWTSGKNLYLPKGVEGTVLYNSYDDVYGNYIIMEVEEMNSKHYYFTVREDKDKTAGLRYYESRYRLKNVNTYGDGSVQVFKDEQLTKKYDSKITLGQLVESNAHKYTNYKTKDGVKYRYFTHKTRNQYGNTVYFAYKKEMEVI